MEKKRQIVWLFYACILCLCFSRTTATLTRMMGLPIQAYFMMTAALVTAALLAVYLPVKLLAGKIRLHVGKLEKRGKMSLTEGSLIVLLLGGLVCVRLFLAPPQVVLEGQLCYESALHSSGTFTGFLAGDLYIYFLHMAMRLFGERYAVFWCNLLLQAVGCSLLFLGIRRMSGTIYAVMALLSVICLPPFFNSTYSAEPQNLLLFFAGVLLWICAYSMEWIIKHPGNRCGMLAACGAGIVSGMFVFTDIRLFGFVLLIVPGFLFFRRKKKTNVKFLAEYECAVLFGFFIMLLINAPVYGQEGTLSQSVSLLLEKWYGSLTSEIYTALRHSPTLAEYWGVVPVYLLAFLGLIGYSAVVPERGVVWVLPLAFFALTEFVSDVPLQEQGIQFIFWGVMSGFGITAMLCPHQEEKEAVVTAVQKTEETQPVKPESRDSSSGGPRPGEYLDNPLPVPKRHIKKEMDYAFEPEPGQMYFELPVADNDDFDV